MACVTGDCESIGMRKPEAKQRKEKAASGAGQLTVVKGRESLPSQAPQQHTIADFFLASTTMEMQEEACNESSRAQLDNKKVQGTLRKVNKAWSKIRAWISLVEERAVVLEQDTGGLQGEVKQQQSQITDLMWKMETLKTGNAGIHFLDLVEGTEGNDSRLFMVKCRIVYLELGLTNTTGASLSYHPETVL
ncbi:hypothetical protein NDU88_002560 [Pleurodeles waltl]|uniref:Uncharacterized protein n=1 Tax=Pleurodeles waltl TaxID=8319 RepID=A0AAV7SDK2_PLEWA|nr:hypothetical protein NDU88_002560 [Pleurodeles waltl]